MRRTLVGLAIAAIAVLTVQVAGAIATPQIVSPTNVAITDRVNALALGDGKLFIGGRMTAPFTRLGAIDPASGAVVWKPAGIASEVLAMDVVGGKLFVGGNFGMRIYDAGTLALLTSFACGKVRAIEPEVSGAGVILGGTFSTCGGLSRINLARIDVATHTVSAGWNARANGNVLSLAADATGVFVGGTFGTINTVSRYRLGKVNLDGTLHPWSSGYVPAIGDTGTAKSVRALDVAAGKLFASWGESVNKTVIYDQAAGTYLKHWGTDGDTQAILADGGNLYLGGHWVQNVGGTASVHFAAYDAARLVKEPVVDPIPQAPMGVFTIVSDGTGGLWLGGDVTGLWGPNQVKVKRLVHLVSSSTPTTTTTTAPTTTTVPDDTTTTTTSTTVPATTTTVPAGDSELPDSQVSTPVAKSTVAATIEFAGTASDDVAVDRVRVAIRNSANQLWLQANGTFGSAFAQFDATLTAKGTASTAWTWTPANPLPAGSYFVQTKAVDTSAKAEAAMPWVAFTVA